MTWPTRISSPASARSFLSQSLSPRQPIGPPACLSSSVHRPTPPLQPWPTRLFSEPSAFASLSPTTRPRPLPSPEVFCPSVKRPQIPCPRRQDRRRSALCVDDHAPRGRHSPHRASSMIWLASHLLRLVILAARHGSAKHVSGGPASPDPRSSFVSIAPLAIKFNTLFTQNEGAVVWGWLARLPRRTVSRLKYSFFCHNGNPAP